MMKIMLAGVAALSIVTPAYCNGPYDEWKARGGWAGKRLARAVTANCEKLADKKHLRKGSNERFDFVVDCSEEYWDNWKNGAFVAPTAAESSVISKEARGTWCLVEEQAEDDEALIYVPAIMDVCRGDGRNADLKIGSNTYSNDDYSCRIVDVKIDVVQFVGRVSRGAARCVSTAGCKWREAVTFHVAPSYGTLEVKSRQFTPSNSCGQNHE